MLVIFLILLVLGAACFLLAALGKPVANFNLVAGGLFLWVLVDLLKTLDRLL